MLMFADENNKAMDKESYVVMPLRRYDELHSAEIKLSLIETLPVVPFKLVTNRYTSETVIQIEVDKDALYHAAVEALRRSYTPDELESFTIVPDSTGMYALTAQLAHKPHAEKVADED